MRSSQPNAYLKACQPITAHVKMKGLEQPNEVLLEVCHSTVDTVTTEKKRLIPFNQQNHRTQPLAFASFSVDQCNRSVVAQNTPLGSKISA